MERTNESNIRRFPLLTRVFIKAAGLLFYLLVRVIAGTVRISFVNREMVQNLRSQGVKYSYGFFHGRQFLLLPFHTKENICVLSSLSRDGEIQKEVLEWFGYSVVRGSSTKGASEGLNELISRGRRGKVPAIAVDGPKGPLHRVKKGIVIVSARTGRVIVPGVAGIERKFILSSWDRFEIPFPFTRAVIIYGEPVLLPEFGQEGRYDEALVMEKVKELEEALDRITLQADTYFRRRG